MRGIVVALTIVPVASMWHFLFYQSYLREFDAFSKKYNRTYDNWDEYLYKYNIFEENYIHIKNMNYQYDTFTLEVNEFADIHRDAFHKQRKGFFSPEINSKKTKSCSAFKSTSSDLPETVDWRNHSAVTPVKNQGQCGSCWSFSATGAMEGAWAIHSGELVSLSEQQLMDCSRAYGDFGCNGGFMDNAFEYAIDYGMCSEKEDPYQEEVESCWECNVVAKFEDCIDINSGNQFFLKEAVSRGPVSIAIEADTRLFQFYSGGIITDTMCGESLDHGVLVVGYGEEQGEKYWLVKNSWGESWGEDGYVRIARSDSENDNGICGIAMQASYPVV
jgi:cathepsin L